MNFKKNHELFWILEVLLLTPLSFFWLGVVSMMMSGSSDILMWVVGQPLNPAKGILVTFLCPLAALWFAYDYMRQNKKDKSASLGVAKTIMAISAVSIVLIIFYLYTQNSSISG